MLSIIDNNILWITLLFSLDNLIFVNYYQQYGKTKKPAEKIRLLGKRD